MAKMRLERHMRIQFYHPHQNQATIIEFKNFEFLSLFYLFPIELLRKECPSLADMPRSAHGIFTQTEWIHKVTSDYFLQAVCDLTAYFVWPAFGIPTYLECFSGYDPLWQLAHATGIWKQAFEQMSGMTAQNLVNAIKHEWEPAELDEFQVLMMKIGERGIEEENLMPVIKAVREMRCIEDYDARGSHAKIDFYRKWYHTRARFKTLSLDQLITGQGSDFQSDAVDSVLGDYVSDPAANFEDAVCSNIDAEEFYKTLNSHDRGILQMRAEGHTYQQIAKEYVYRTHSAVIKRIRRIAEKYFNFADEKEELREFLNR